MTAYPKRLIEVDLPIKRISAHARREKSIRHGHISTLHIWWARRPLAACRAVICAALWPDPADDLCPDVFRDTARRLMGRWARDHLRLAGEESFKRFVMIQKEPRCLDDNTVLRQALLDFIADFANWDNSTVKEYLETSRALTQAAHEAMGGAPGTRPLVVDPFAGGGAIPLEALRVGADAFASDLNPVAVLLNRVVLEYIPKYGQRLADEVRKRGEWIKQEIEKELAEFYPKDPDGATPIAYLWARTIKCEGPGCGAEVPLIRSLWLAKKGRNSVALRLVPHPQAKRVDFEIIEKAKAAEVGSGTVARGSATCPCCRFTSPVESVRRQLSERRGGAEEARLYAVVTLRPSETGRVFRLPDARDLRVVRNAHVELDRRRRANHESLTLVPDEKFTGLEPRRIPVTQYGMAGFGDLFTSRQLLAITTLVRLARQACDPADGQMERSLTEAVLTCLSLQIDKLADLNNSLVRWDATVQCPHNLFARQAIPMVWDFAESCPLGDSSGSIGVLLERFSHVMEKIGSDWRVGQFAQASATAHPLPDDFADAIVTDPPYYYSVPYSDLSDFFYVWLRRCLYDVHSELFSASLTPKEEECVQNLPHADVAHLQKDRVFYEKAMCKALTDGRRIVKPEGVAIVVFAHSKTEAWEALLSALVDAGWRVTASWPIDTEASNRILAQRQSTLASSVHLTCRPRENPEGSVRDSDVGDWRDVLAELPGCIHDWMPRLVEEGVVGADAIFACLGPALEVFSRYSRVEKASGEAVTLKEYLEQVWAAVAKEALTVIFAGADAAGFEEDARLTAMWLWTLNAGAPNGGNGESAGADDEDEEDESKAKAGKSKNGFVLEYDAARKIAQGLGAHLEKLTDVVEVKGDTARLLSVAERTKALFGRDQAEVPTSRRKKADTQMRLGFMAELETAEAAGGGWGEKSTSKAGTTALDRLHQAMIMFAAGRGEALKRFLVDNGVGRDGRFWRLAQALSALYPPATDEKRWVDGVLARKKGLGF